MLAQIYKARDKQLAEYHLAEGRRLLPDDLYHRAMVLPSEESEEAVRLLTELLEREDTTNSLSSQWDDFDVIWNRAWRYFDLRHYGKMLEDAEYLSPQSQSAIAWNVKGVALARLYKMQEALDAFNKAIARSKRNATTYLNRADVYMKLGRLDEALADCDQAIQYEPKFANSYAQKAIVHFAKGERAADTATERRELGAALTYCNAALTRQPHNALAHWARARIWRHQASALMRNDDLRAAAEYHQKALHDLEIAVQREPRNPDFLCVRGEAYFSMRQFEQSVADFSLVLSLDPGCAKAHYGRALGEQRLGRAESAMADFDQAIRLDPANEAFFHGRGRLWRWLGDYGRALNDHMEVVHLADSAPAAYTGRGITRWLMSDYAGAADDIQTAVLLDPDGTAPMLLWLSALHALCSEPQTAQEDLAWASEIYADEWRQELIAFFSGECTAEELQASADGPYQADDAMFYMGLAELAQGRRPQAEEWFTRYVGRNAPELAMYDIAKGHLPATPAATAVTEFHKSASH